ncbi:MAG TPA: hypothetical protein VGQ83_13795 [Polyangia bacterium]|jgi:hypothetical protein
MRSGLLFLVLVVSACGPKAGTPVSAPATPKSTAPARPQPPPELPFEVKSVHGFASKERCSQGPLDLEVEALGADRVERLVVLACGPRAIGGRYHLSSPWYEQTGSFGSEQPANERCIAKAGERVTVTDGTGAAGPSGAKAAPGKGKGKKQKPGETPDAPKPVAVPWTADRACERSLTVVDQSWTANGGSPLKAGARLRVRLWSAAPNDLEGVVFVVRQLALAATVTNDQWQEYRRRDDAYDKALRAYIDKLPSCGTPEAVHHTCAVRKPDPSKAAQPSAPPPPPRAEKRPPRPSANADWVPGYWHWGQERWGWIAGWWRVPQSDVAGNLTARAPAPPPALKHERPDARPTEGAVWVPGHWMWSEGWVWVDGGWRLAPGPGYRWQAPEWRRVPSGMVFIPGGWVR